MRITVDFPGYYNHRRYSRPWIAKVTSWPVGQRPELEFGTCLGREGGPDNQVEIDASEGDIIRWGQRDRRQSKKSESYWGYVKDTRLVECTEREARHIREEVAS